MKHAAKLIAMLLALVMLALPVCAADNFTPSVGQKEENILVSVGGDAAIVVYDEEGNIVDYIPAPDIRVTSYSHRNDAPQEVAESLSTAYESVAQAQSLPQIMSFLDDVLEETIAKLERDGASMTNWEGLSGENMVVSDLLNLELDSYGESILHEGEAAGICLHLTVEEGVPFVIVRWVRRADLPADYVIPGEEMEEQIEEQVEEQNMISRLWKGLKGLFATKETVEEFKEEAAEAESEYVWIPVEPEDITIEEDGNVTVRLHKIGDNLGTIAVIRPIVED